MIKKRVTWVQSHPQSPLRLRASLEAISYLMETTSDQKIRLDESSSHYHVIIQDCIACLAWPSSVPAIVTIMSA